MEVPDWLASVADDPAYGWARTGWERAASVPGAWYDAGKADQIVEQWPRHFRLTSDRFKGKPFRLLPWQEITVRLLVGWKMPIEVIDPDTHLPVVVHVRVFRRLDLWIPRKNGKSEFLAALAILFFVLERVPGGEMYVFALTEDQGSIPFSKIKEMLTENKALMEDAWGNPRIIIYQDSIYIREDHRTAELLSGKPDGKHGRSPTVIVGDEVHEWRTRTVADNLRQGTGARLQPIELYASTAGAVETNAIGYAWYQESMSVLSGESADKTVLVVAFGLTADDDWEDERLWKRANPSLGLTPTLHFMRSEYTKAKGKPVQEAKFRCYHLNQWLDVVNGWIPLAKWKAGAHDREGWRTAWKRNTGRRCFLACDVSATQDITALVAAFPPDAAIDHWVLIPRFWIPEDTIQVRSEKDRRVNWRGWVADGVLEATPGNAVDQNFILEAIMRACEDFEVVTFGYDPWNAVKLAGDLQREGMPVEMQRRMRQGTPTLGEPTKEFERLAFAGMIDHGGHPVLSWMVGHCQVRFDENLNYVPAKRKSADKIDGVVASVMAIGLSMEQVEDTSIPADAAGAV